MALSGSKTIDATPNSCDLLVFSWEAVQDQATNSSTINWTMTLVADEDYGLITGVEEGTRTWSVTIDGQTFTGQNGVNVDYGETRLLAEGSIVLTHDEDGTRSFDFTFSQEIGITWGASSDNPTEIGTITGSGTGELDPFEIIEKYDILGHINGYIMRICGTARRSPTAEPVAFLYNGEQLPALPVVEGYAFIYKLGSTYTVVFADSYEFGSSSENVFWHITVPDGSIAYMLTSANEWRQLSSTSAREVNYEYITWANFDVIDPSGEVYLAASAPVPVYE